MNDPVSFLSSVLAILALWIAYDAGYRPYRTNLLRDRLFELRAELFECAKDGMFGASGFSDPVYQRTRRFLNSSIRFAHQFTLSRLFILLWSSRWWLDSERMECQRAAFREALAVRSPDARDRIKHIMQEAHVSIVEHMVYVNVLGFALFTSLAFCFRCLHAQQRMRAAFAARIIQNRKMLEPLERDALYGLERIERRQLAGNG